MTDQKLTFSKLHQNLTILQEREAKYGGNVPLELLNQIHDHKLAIALTQRATAGQLSQVEWEEALKPLMLAIHNGQVVSIEAEIYIAAKRIFLQKVGGGYIFIHQLLLEHFANMKVN